MPEPKFLADCMLAKLARWLAFLGYDSAYARKEQHEDKGLLQRAKKEGRIFLTRDTRIPEVAGIRKIVIREQRFEDQLKRVLSETGLQPDPGRFFTRCTLCNAPLEKQDKQDILEELPEKVRGLDSEFFRCPECRKLYWPGTHVHNTIEKLRRAGVLPS